MTKWRQGVCWYAGDNRGSWRKVQQPNNRARPIHGVWRVWSGILALGNTNTTPNDRAVPCRAARITRQRPAEPKIANILAQNSRSLSLFVSPKRRSENVYESNKLLHTGSTKRGCIIQQTSLPYPPQLTAESNGK